MYLSSNFNKSSRSYLFTVVYILFVPTLLQKSALNGHVHVVSFYVYIFGIHIHNDLECRTTRLHFSWLIFDFGDFKTIPKIWFYSGDKKWRVETSSLERKKRILDMYHEKFFDDNIVESNKEHKI